LTQASKVTAQQSTTAPTGFVSSTLITSSSSYSVIASDVFEFGQRIEGLNMSDLNYGTANAVTTTLSFWVRSSLTGTFGGRFANSAQDYSYPFSFTISSADTWEYKTVVVPGPTSGTWLTTNSIGLRVFFSLGTGSDYLGTAGAWTASDNRGVTGQVNLVGTSGATFYITGVQLEAGSVATPFERRSYGQELSLCQRYYQISLAGHTAYVTNLFGYGSYVPFSVRMRSAPTITLISSLAAVNFGATIGSFASTLAEGYLYEKVATSTAGGRYLDSLAATAEL